MKNRFFSAPVSVSLIASIAVLNAAFLPLRPATAQAPRANRGTTSSLEAWRAFRVLEKADYFALGGVGFAGRTSPGETALRALLKEENGPVLMRGLFKTATPAGKLYALVGLKQTGTPREVAEVAEGFRKRKETVKTFRGCIGGNEAIGTLATQIEKGQLVSPAERVKPGAK